MKTEDVDLTDETIDSILNRTVESTLILEEDPPTELDVTKAIQEIEGFSQDELILAGQGAIYNEDGKLVKVFFRTTNDTPTYYAYFAKDELSRQPSRIQKVNDLGILSEDSSSPDHTISLYKYGTWYKRPAEDAEAKKRDIFDGRYGSFTPIWPLFASEEDELESKVHTVALAQIHLETEKNPDQYISLELLEDFIEDSNRIYLELNDLVGQLRDESYSDRLTFRTEIRQYFDRFYAFDPELLPDGLDLIEPEIELLTRFESGLNVYRQYISGDLIDSSMLYEERNNMILFRNIMIRSFLLENGMSFEPDVETNDELKLEDTLRLYYQRILDRVREDALM